MQPHFSCSDLIYAPKASGVPFKTAPEMIAWAKANPGKLSLGTNGEGGYLVRDIGLKPR